MFINLLAHSDRSLLRGMFSVDDYVKVCTESGYAALAEFGNMNSAASLMSACKIHNIKPIHGCMFNLVSDKKQKKQGGSVIPVFAMNRVGFTNLVKLVTVSYMYFYYVPRIDYSDLVKYSEGIVCFTGSSKGPLAQEFYQSSHEGMCKFIDKLRSDQINYRFEIQFENSDIQRTYNDAVKFVADKYDPESNDVIATHDVYYLDVNDIDCHQRFVSCKQVTKTEFVYPYNGYHHYSDNEEMNFKLNDMYPNISDLDKSFYEKAISNTLRFAQSVEVFNYREGIKIPRYIHDDEKKAE